MRTGLCSEARRVVAAAKELGFTWELTRGNHMKFTKPGCPPVYTAFTPSDRRAASNAIATLRRAAKSVAC